MNVGELREALASVPDDAAVMLMFENVLRHAVGVTVAPNGGFAVIRNQGQSRPYKHYSVAEDGLIGGLSAMGMSNEAIAELLERTSESIRRRKKSIGLS